MPSPTVTTETRDHVFLIGLNRPEKRNAFNPEMFRALASAYGRLDAAPELRCGVLFAHGEHFTGGLDLVQWSDVLASGKELELPAGALDPLGRYGERVRKPIVIAVQGWCLTIGLELMLACDVRIAAASTRLSQLEVKRGIYATGGATLRLPEEIGWGRAMQYLLTGDEIALQDALQWGLVQEAVPHGQQLQRALEIAGRIAAQAPLAVQATLRSARIARSEGHLAAIARLRADQAALMQTDDAKEGVASFLERRSAVFKGR
jgi:enoyl-CoA hydratase